MLKSLKKIENINDFLNYGKFLSKRKCQRRTDWHTHTHTHTHTRIHSRSVLSLYIRLWILGTSLYNVYMEARMSLSNVFILRMRSLGQNRPLSTEHRICGRGQLLVGTLCAATNWKMGGSGASSGVKVGSILLAVWPAANPWALPERCCSG